MKKFHFGFFIAAVFIAARLNADSGKEGASFLDVPVGAGPSALGGAYTALAVDAYAPAYNPAGLPYTGEPQVAAQHLDYLQDFNHEFISVGFPLGQRHGLGATGEYMGSNALDRTDANGAKTGEFSGSYSMIGVSYGFKLIENFSLGATGKMVRANLDGHGARTFALDLGGFYKLTGKVNLGAAVTNLGSGLTFENQSDPLPMAYKAGAAFHPTSSWTFTLEGIARRVKTINAQGGAQWRPVPMIALRAGYRTATARDAAAGAGLTAGVGVMFLGQEFSYAYLPLDELGNTNYFSLLLKFGPPAQSWMETTSTQRNVMTYSNDETGVETAPAQ